MPLPFLTHTFSSGPHISVEFIPDGPGDFKVQLVESSQFSASFFVNLEDSLSQNFLAWLKAYGEKCPTPLNFLPKLDSSSFQEKILNTLIKVPFGETISYGALALSSGHNKASRAVGTVCRKNKLPLFIPCHRVIQSNGLLGGFAFGLPLKKTLLDFEQST